MVVWGARGIARLFVAVVRLLWWCRTPAASLGCLCDGCEVVVVVWGVRGIAGLFGGTARLLWRYGIIVVEWKWIFWVIGFLKGDFDE